MDPMDTRWFMELHERLRSIRERAGLSQDRLAAILHRPQAWVSRRETGQVPPTHEEIAEIADACGYRVDMVFLPSDSAGADLAELLASLDPGDVAALADVLRAFPRMDASMRSFLLAQLRFASSAAP